MKSPNLVSVAWLRRVGAMASTLLVTSFLVFSSLYLAPGDPVAFLVKGRSPSPEQLAAIRHEYGFDKPFPVRYWDWLTGLLHGDFGQSYQLHASVASVIGSRLPSTLLLVALATVLIVVLGVGLGVFGALRGGKGVVVAVTVGAAVPSFTAAIVLRSVFGVRLGWFPTVGTGSGFGDELHHMLLPAIALAITFMALVTRVTRAAMLEELGREHVEVVTSRGLPRTAVIRRHVLRNALGPVVTVSALLISGLLVSTAIVESAFGMNGVGSLLVSSVNHMDFPVVQAVVLLVVAAFVVVNTVVDLVYPVIDPRVRAAR
ncbi:ABC transporter permease [Catenulispora subtropica]|uniref:ABC transporter permease n=1 Tax=Catenulispora subtropica TaxID=450798 RepID=A0ABN2S3J4_9ACTN